MKGSNVSPFACNTQLNARTMCMSPRYNNCAHYFQSNIFFSQCLKIFWLQPPLILPSATQVKESLLAALLPVIDTRGTKRKGAQPSRDFVMGFLLKERRLLFSPTYWKPEGEIWRMKLKNHRKVRKVLNFCQNYRSCRTRKRRHS